MKAFNDLADFSTEEIRALVELAGRLDANPEPEALKGKVLSLLFLSPSLRTLASFQAAKVGWTGFDRLRPTSRPKAPRRSLSSAGRFFWVRASV